MGIESILTTVIPIIVTLAWEHWLGKTKKLDANSTADILVSLSKKIIGSALKNK